MLRKHIIATEMKKKTKQNESSHEYAILLKVYLEIHSSKLSYWHHFLSIYPTDIVCNFFCRY